MQERIAQAGRAWVLENYNWRTTYRAWDAIYSPNPARVNREAQPA
jgi:hypothetical protein